MIVYRKYKTYGGRNYIKFCMKVVALASSATNLNMNIFYR